jgi:exosortase A-associated hydrolase 1
MSIRNTAAVEEKALLFDCAGEPSVGIISLPAGQQAGVGVLIVVGGPQYRVGSHRQFVRLARYLAAHGVAAMRFDYRGMGDSWAEGRDFEQVECDLRSAMDRFMAEVPGMQRVVLWGLCDGASAACLYAPLDRRVAGLVLVNPWVHTEESASTTRLRHYYLRRFFQAAFWRRVLLGQLNVRAAAADVWGHLGTAWRAVRGAGRSASGGAPSLPRRMALALESAALPVAIALSTDDYVAREFEDHALPSQDWIRVAGRHLLALERIQDADHTLSAPEWESRAEQLALGWVQAMARQREPARPGLLSQVSAFAWGALEYLPEFIPL